MHVCFGSFTVPKKILACHKSLQHERWGAVSTRKKFVETNKVDLKEQSSLIGTRQSIFFQIDPGLGENGDEFIEDRIFTPTPNPRIPY